jgi:hypothetical protein
MLETRKVKNTTVWVTRVRSRLVCRRGRMSSIEAPVVPTKDASRLPRARKAVFTSGVASRSPRSKTPPAIT